MPADSPNDSAGVPITVGATVKLVCTVLSIDLLNNRFGDITVQISNPLAASFGPATSQATGADVNPPNYKKVLSFPPAVLTVV